MNIAEKVIKIIFDEVYPISGQSFRQITQLVEYKTIPKNEVFIQRGRTNSSEYFILEGICRSYLVNPDGDDIMISFFQAPAVLSPHITRTKDGLSLLYFQAITDLQVAYFSEKALVELMIENQEIRFFANTVLLDELIELLGKCQVNIRDCCPIWLDDQSSLFSFKCH